MTTPFTLRRGGRADAPAVAAIGARLFAQAYGATHPEPELGRYLARTFDLEALRSALGDPEHAVILAEAEEAAVGYAHLRATVGPPPAGVSGRRPVEVLRFYVDAAWHGRGVAQALMAAAESHARRLGGDTLWLDVWQEAARPFAFYRRAGFAVVGATTFAWGERRDADFVMARALPTAPGADDVEGPLGRLDPLHRHAHDRSGPVVT